MKTISILIPCYNEELNIGPLTEELVTQLSSLSDYDYEIVFIDNDSKDNTREIIRDICSHNNRIKAIFNAKNFGPNSSPYYGMMQCSGDCVILMTCDFQDPVYMIPEYIEAWEQGYKIVLGQKIRSQENRVVYAARSLYYKFMKKHADVDFLSQVTGAGLYDKEFIEIMKSVDDYRPLLKGMIAEYGYGVKLIPFEQPKRKNGKSSNNFFSYMDMVAQSLTTYTKYGCRLALGCGVVSVIASIFTILWFIAYKIINWDTFRFEEYVFSLVLILLCSLNILFVGIVGEYVMNVNLNVRKKPLVVELERINF